MSHAFHIITSLYFDFGKVVSYGMTTLYVVCIAYVYDKCLCRMHFIEFWESHRTGLFSKIRSDFVNENGPTSMSITLRSFYSM